MMDSFFTYTDKHFLVKFQEDGLYKALQVKDLENIDGSYIEAVKLVKDLEVMARYGKEFYKAVIVEISGKYTTITINH